MPAPAGAGWKNFVSGDVASEADFDQYLMAQSLMRFATTTARDTVLTGSNAPVEGMHCYIDADNCIYYYDGSAWVKRAAVFYDTMTWAIAGSIAVPSGDTDFLVPALIRVHSNETVVIDSVRYVINSGTSVTFKLQQNGSDVTGFTGISCTTTAASTDPTDVALANNDKLAPVVTAVSGSPKNMTVSVALKRTVLLS